MRFGVGCLTWRCSTGAIVDVTLARLCACVALVIAATMSDTDIDDELFAFHLYLDSLSQDVRDRLLTELNKRQAPVQQDIDASNLQSGR